MKQICLELDDRCARDLEQVAPAKQRKRAEFLQLAIRHAVDVALNRTTAEAYRAQPLSFITNVMDAADLTGWDPHNALAKPASRARPRRVTPARRKRVA